MCEGPSIKSIIREYEKYFTVEEAIINDPFCTPETDINIIYHKEFKLKDIVKELQYICPNCIFSIIRCLGLNRYYMEDKFKFNYKKALGNWWKLTNKEAQEQEEREVYY